MSAKEHKLLQEVQNKAHPLSMTDNSEFTSENHVLKALCTPPRPIAFLPPIEEPELIDFPIRGHGKPMKDWMAKQQEQFRIAYEEVEDKQVMKWLVDIKADKETAKKLQEKEKDKAAVTLSEDKGKGSSSGAAQASTSEESPERSQPSMCGEKKAMPEVKGLWMLVSEGLECTNCIIKKADCWVQVEVSGGRSIFKCLVCHNCKVKCSLESGKNKKAKKSVATLPDEESADNIRKILLEVKTLRTDMEDAQAKKFATLEKKMGRLEKKLNVILAWVGAKESLSKEEPEDKAKGKAKAKAEESEEENSEEEESEEDEEEESEEEKTPQPRMTQSQKGKGAQ
ncbi:hypothetical protein VNI00_016980 [Paramarasmius palmivorus]|uniref:Uncharacterized protein n=1 Tax=Paramarasmius palmivorus TaxID=297713 RepID=A0AAW0B9A4_9AGAR